MTTALQMLWFKLIRFKIFSLSRLPSSVWVLMRCLHVCLPTFLKSNAWNFSFRLTWISEYFSTTINVLVQAASIRSVDKPHPQFVRSSFGKKKKKIKAIQFEVPVKSYFYLSNKEEQIWFQNTNIKVTRSCCDLSHSSSLKWNFICGTCPFHLNSV